MNLCFIEHMDNVQVLEFVPLMRNVYIFCFQKVKPNTKQLYNVTYV